CATPIAPRVRRICNTRRRNSRRSKESYWNSSCEWESHGPHQELPRSDRVAEGLGSRGSRVRADGSLSCARTFWPRVPNATERGVHSLEHRGRSPSAYARVLEPSRDRARVSWRTGYAIDPRVQAPIHRRERCFAAGGAHRRSWPNHTRSDAKRRE